MSSQDSKITAADLGLQLENMQFDLDAERGVARLGIDQPEKMNRVTMPMRDQISNLFRTLEKDGRARVVIVRGAGEDAFTAGGEISGFLETHPSHLSLLHENVAAPSGSRARSSRRSTDAASAWGWRSPFLAISASPRPGRCSACRRSV